VKFDSRAWTPVPSKEKGQLDSQKPVSASRLRRCLLQELDFVKWALVSLVGRVGRWTSKWVPRSQRSALSADCMINHFGHQTYYGSIAIYEIRSK
jgi:hypothetical protein